MLSAYPLRMIALSRTRIAAASRCPALLFAYVCFNTSGTRPPKGMIGTHFLLIDRPIGIFAQKQPRLFRQIPHAFQVRTLGVTPHLGEAVWY